MRISFKFGAIILISVLAAGCGKKTAQLQSKAVPPDKTLYENATKYLDRSQFIKARLAFQTLITTYPDSDFTPKAFFEVGDTYYKEGGTESLLQAEAQYRDFQLFYPTSELAAEAQFKIASVHMRMMLQPERDPTHAKKAEEELKRFISKFPDHELTSIAKLYLQDVMENQAVSKSKIGDYYQSKRVFKAAVGRFQEVLEQYPDYSKTDEILFKMGSALEKLNRQDEAAIYYSRLSAEYPDSVKVAEARKRLEELKKPIPPVNEAAAELHKQRMINDSGFSVLRPLKDFASAMGLTGQGDPYSKALKLIEESKQAEELAASAQKGAETAPKGESAEDIVISTTISKSAGQPATDKTTVRDPGKKKAEPAKADAGKVKKEPEKPKKPGV
jgi:outer membrane assembly lipoprotein YfiO